MHVLERGQSTTLIVTERDPLTKKKKKKTCRSDKSITLILLIKLTKKIQISQVGSVRKGAVHHSHTRQSQSESSTGLYGGLSSYVRLSLRLISLR